MLDGNDGVGGRYGRRDGTSLVEKGSRPEACADWVELGTLRVRMSMGKIWEGRSHGEGI